MTGLADEVDALAESGDFAGVVSVSRGDRVEFERAYGFADRAHAVAANVDTQFAIASGTKGFTALVVMGLVGDGALSLDTAARSLLGADLPLVGDHVTVAHLLAHTSGIGDYFDEEADTDINDYVLPVPVHQLATTESYLAVLGGRPAKFGAGERFAYCNGGYVVLALLAERASGQPFPDLVQMRVCAPAGMVDTAFLRSDELPGRVALGYLPGGSRTNVYHLPVVGSGDGGAYSTAADFRAFWSALFAGQIVPRDVVDEMVRPRSDVPAEGMRYGLGFWLHATGPAVLLEGYDAGVSFRSVHDPTSGVTHTVLANSSDGAWPITRHLDTLLG
ncbi:MAG: hypothetical protein QOF92_3399 [Pseudonocardiales bacterium]|nr:hypothetical protein [Pseudonocardiales bacterium]